MIHFDLFIKIQNTFEKNKKIQNEINASRLNENYSFYFTRVK